MTDATPRRRRPQALLCTLFVSAVLLLLVGRFIAVGMDSLHENWNSDRSDQGGYMQLGLNFHGHGLALQRLSDRREPLIHAIFTQHDGFLTDGSRHPLYPLLLSTLASRNWDYFTSGKLLNLAVGVAVLLALFWVVRRQFGLAAALLATALLSVNSEFITLSSMVMCEPLLMLWFILAWGFTVEGFRQPRKWLLAGASAGLAFLTKGTAPALVGAFLITVAVVWGRRALRDRRWLLFLVPFMALALPFLAYNAWVFGSPFYNFNYEYVPWLDNWPQVRAVYHAWPTMSSYLQSHSLAEILDHEWRGLLLTRILFVYTLLPTELENAFRRVYVDYGLVIGLVLVALFHARLARFVRQHLASAISAGVLFVAVMLPLTWGLEADPNPRFFMPVVPLFLAFFAAALVGLVRWPAQWLRPARRTWSGYGAAAAGLVAVVALTGTALPKFGSVFVDPYALDRSRNERSEAVLDWLSANVRDKTTVLFGASHLLPRWKYTDRFRFVVVPSDMPDWATLRQYCREQNVQYAIIDAETVNSRLDLLGRYFELVNGRVLVRTMPDGWLPTYGLNDLPSEWLIFQPSDAVSIDHALNVRADDSIALAGYSLSATELKPGDTLHVTLFWETLAPESRSFTVFTHLLDAAGQMRGQSDGLPANGAFPTSTWAPGWRIADRHDIRIDPAAPPGEYRIACGLYELETMERAVLHDGAGELPDRQLLLEGPLIR